MQKKNQSVLKIEAVTPHTLVVGIDIAKHNHWARFVDYRGFEYSKAMEFKNNKKGFNAIITEIDKICKEKDFNKVIVGLEPTGHYWKTLANFLMKQEKIEVVLVNPYHTKKVKELDDNSPTKSDRKDSLTIARLVKDGRYFESYLPHDIYAELRVLSNTRVSMNKRKKSLENIITAVLDEYFPEFTDVFKCPFKGKVSMQILKECPTPRMILQKGESGVLIEIKKAVKKSVGEKKALELVKVAKDSVGVDYGEYGAEYKISRIVEELELINKHLEEIGVEMERLLKATGISEYLLSIKGLGIVSASMCLGEIGDPLRFNDSRQLIRLAGYNLIEDSSGKCKSRTCISKRGRKNLRCILYQMSLVMVSRNEEMKVLYNYLKTRSKNPLKQKQALVVISKKILTLIFTLSKKKEKYDSTRVFGDVRKSQLGVA